MKQLNKISFNTSILLIIFLFFLIFCFLFYNHKLKTFNNDIETIKQEHIKKIKETLKKEINLAVDFIHFKKTTTQQRLKDELKYIVDQGYNIADGIYKSMKDTHSKEQILQTINAALKDMRFFDERGYFFIYTLDGKNILHPIYPIVEGTYKHRSLKDSNNINILQSASELIKKNGKGFIEYEFYSIDDPSKLDKKIGYLKKLPFYDIYIGTAEYLKDFELKVKKEIFQRLSHIRFGKDGYLFIDSYDGTILMHPMKPHIVGKNLINYQDSNGKYVIKKLIEAAKKEHGDFIYYSWHRPYSTSKEINKISFAMGVQDWEWMVGGGLYIDDINKELLLKEEQFKDKLTEELGFLFLSVVILLLILFFIINWINKKTQKSITSMIQFFINAGDNNIFLDEKEIYFKEFQALSQVINSMISHRIKNEKKLLQAKNNIKQQKKELQKLNKELQVLTNIDPLSNAYNRRYFYSVTKELITLNKRNKQNLSLGMIDIDNFKKINDTYGHDKGDLVIQTLVQTIKNLIRESDVLVRFGGEEFILVFPNTTLDHAALVMEKIRKEIEKLTIKKDISFTISGGTSELLQDETSIDKLVKRADKRLYKAKNSGKNIIL
jgi:diguanylate cyclase (GGDEF)-like protein